MSHNTYSVNGATPDATGAISAPAEAAFIAVGRGESDAYDNSPAVNFNIGADFYFYDTAPRNTISGATLTTSANWCSTFSLPAGKYVVKWQTHVEDTGSSWYLAVGLFEGTTRRGANYIGASANADQSNGIGQAVLTPTTQTTYNFEVVTSGSVDTVLNQGTTPSQYGAFFVFKVG